MSRILSVIKEAGFEHILPCERVSLDYDRFLEYQDSNEHQAEEPFERPPLKAIGNKLAVSEVPCGTPSILRYFLDGSRRTYKVADVILDGHYLPLVAGQVGVAVARTCRGGRVVEILRDFCHFENVLAFPDRAKEDLETLKAELARAGMPSFELVYYEVKPDREPVDLGVAAIMKRMQDLEVKAIGALSDRRLLGNDALLVVDGPLRFKEMRGRKFDIVQFRNVLGLSKSFRPSFTVGTGRSRVDVGAITSWLDFAERTTVFRTLEDDKPIGMWYLRMRPRRMMPNPLDGIVKIECYAVDPEDQEDGFDSQKVDVISRHLLQQRNVTPFKADSRWANHIYPIYLAEKYLKSSFMSDTRFKALF
jgi:hypothetical protein